MSAKRSAKKRFWIVAAAAIALVTLPVIPFTFFAEKSTDAFKQLSNQKSKPVLGANTKEQMSSDGEYGLLENSLKTLLKQVGTTPHDAGLHNKIGMIYLEMSEITPAINHFEEAIAASRSARKQLHREAAQANLSGNRELASQKIIEITRNNVHLAAAHSSLARLYDKQGRSDKVLAHLSELDSDIGFSMLEANKDKTASSAGKSRFEQLFMSKNQTLTQNQSNSNVQNIDPQTAALLARATGLYQSGRYMEAIEDYKRLVNILPNNASIHRELGLSALAVHNFQLAEGELARSIQLGGNDAEAHNALGSIYLNTGRVDLAKNELESALALNPNLSAASYNLGNILAGMGKYPEAIQAFHRVIMVEPRSAAAHNNLATMLSLVGNYDEAIHEFKQSVALAPNMASAHYGLGLALMNTKRYHESIPPFRKALALNPGLVDIHNKIELAQRRSGDNNAAMHSSFKYN
ncbi:tetratricopeptide repeat protein [bacterium]|nr:tetratricopeptide repeat protein [bacterium]QQR58828.1 MAG: tetratricopeptide repeat protein [Candidatus Melainabacteria bacterium]